MPKNVLRILTITFSKHHKRIVVNYVTFETIHTKIVIKKCKIIVINITITNIKRIKDITKFKRDMEVRRAKWQYVT